MAAGLFVTFEGIEASGKSTQVKLLHDYLATTSLPFVFTREPGGTPLGERLREILSDPHANITAEAETLIFSASRAQLVSDVIVPALRDGKLVVCDRFWDATLAYQGFARGLPVDTIMRITAFAARDRRFRFSRFARRNVAEQVDEQRRPRHVNRPRRVTRALSLREVAIAPARDFFDRRQIDQSGGKCVCHLAVGEMNFAAATPSRFHSQHGVAANDAFERNQIDERNVADAVVLSVAWIN